MTLVLFGLVLPVFLTCCDAVNLQDPVNDCEDCNQSGPWWPLFKPSQIIHSEFPEHAQHSSQERSSQVEPQVAGIDSGVRTYTSQGRHRVEWDHYGDVSRVTTAGYNSLETRSDSPAAPPNSVETHTSGENGRGSGSVEAEVNKDISATEKDGKSQDASFFEDSSFFDETFPEGKDNFPRDFEISQESSLSEEAHESSNSIEHLGSHEGFGRAKRPVATSYSSISSIFAPARIVHHQPRDLLHPDLLDYNGVANYIKSRVNSPMSRFQFYNGRNLSHQYLVHEPLQEEPGALRIDHRPFPVIPSGRMSGRPYVPLDHPVYRYVKNHGGLLHHYRQPLSRSSTLRWQDIHPNLRSKFPFKHLQPYVRVQNHQTLVHHVVPTKDPFSDSFWKESRKIENLKPPPLGQNLLLFKNPNAVDSKRFGRRQGQNYVYLVRRKRLL